MTPDPLTYLYAVRTATGPGPGSVPGVDGERPRLVVEGELAAVVGSVDASRFDEEALARDLEDLRRLESLARAHHAVVAEAARTQPTAPVRLATLYRDDEAVRRLLADRAEEFTAILERIEGRWEWGVKAYVKPTTRPEEREAGSPSASDRPGTSYLLRRRADRDRGERERERARTDADDLHRTLRTHAAAGRLFPLQDARLSGRADEMVLNATYLVDAGKEDGFRSTVDSVDGATVELTGPWPPFSFASLEST
jgi:hypothetical protein